MNPWVVRVSMYFCVCLYMCLYMTLILLLCLWLAMHVYMCLCLYVSAYVFPCVCVSVCVIVGGVYVCVTMCLRMHLCVSACVHVQMWSITWADPQRERLTSPSVHSSFPLWSMVPSRALPGSRLCPPHQTSLHCPSSASVKRKEGEICGGSNNNTVGELVFVCLPTKALIMSPFTDAEIKARSDSESYWGQ